MESKPRPNHRLYLDVLRLMTPEERLLKAFELTELSRALFRRGLELRYPDRTEAEIDRLYLDRLARCHNRRS